MIACRDVGLGREAARDLRENNGEFPCDAVACPVPLDLTDPTSIENVASWVTKEYGGVLDVLVNNAAVCFNDPTLYGRVEYTPFEDQAGITIETNYFGTLATIQSFLPLLERSSSPRIINVASAAGRLTILRSQHLVNAFTSESLTVPELSKLMRQFTSDVEDGTHAARGWPNTCYGVSKLGIIALTRVLARERPGIMIYSVDPGYCRTDQNDNQGVVDPAEGAYTPYLLALMETNEEGEGKEGVDALSGLHFYEKSEMPWTYQR